MDVYIVHSICSANFRFRFTIDCSAFFVSMEDFPVMIERFSFRRLFSLICAIALVFSSVPSLAEGMEPATTHAIENETPVLEADAANTQSASANETAGENALFGIAISKPIATEAPVHLDVALDFSAYRVENEASEPLVEYDTDNAYVTMDLARLLRDDSLGDVKETTVSTSEADISAIAVESLHAAAEDASDDIRYEDGALIMTDDGQIDLTDGANTVSVPVKGYSILLSKLLIADGVTISVLSGFVPAGSSPVLDQLSQEEAESARSAPLLRSAATSSAAAQPSLPPFRMAPLQRRAAPDRSRMTFPMRPAIQSRQATPRTPAN